MTIPRLSICIPTHEGRRDYLFELLQSINRQLDQTTKDAVSVCVSDNGSQDGTSEMISSFQTRAIFKLSYFRFEKNEGLLNFENVIAMADGDYCWMIGSDDIVPDHAITRLLEIISSAPERAGFTINKLNFNLDYSKLIGRDHDVVMPINWTEARNFQSFEDTMSEIFFLFQFISAHIFRKDRWDFAFAQFGRQGFEEMRHFAFSGIIIQIVKNANHWAWYPDFLITQRLGNSCLVEEFGKLEFALQCSSDLILVMDKILFEHKEISDLRNKILRKIFIIYWNPLSILEYKAEHPWSIKYDLKMITFTAPKFYRQPLYLGTTVPALCLPGPLGLVIRHLGIEAWKLLQFPVLIPVKMMLKFLFIRFLRLLNVQSNILEETDSYVNDCGVQTLNYVKELSAINSKGSFLS